MGENTRGLAVDGEKSSDREGICFVYTSGRGERKAFSWCENPCGVICLKTSAHSWL